MKELAQELKEEFKKGNLKPSQLKKSRSTGNLTSQHTKPFLKKNKSAEELKPNSQLEQLETNQRELTELNSLSEENKHLKAQNTNKQKQIEELRKTLEEKTQQLALAQKELDNTVEASSEELINQEERISELRSQVAQLQQEKQSLQRDLNLTSRLAEMRKVPYFEEEFNSSLTYFKYGIYALLTVWFLLVLRRENV